MKKLNKSILALALCSSLSFSSCDKILEVEQVSEITSASMWKSEGDFTASVNGMYSQFRELFATNLLLWGDLRADLYAEGKMVEVGHANIMKNTIYRDNVGTDWSGIYTTINTSNLIIKYAKQNLQEGKVQSDALADAYFIRAFNYFWIARIWGDAPLLINGFESDKQDDLLPSRSPKNDIFAQVELDILEAEKYVLASKTNKSKVTPSAVKMLKAEYFLWKAKQLAGGNQALTTANQAIEAVIASNNTLLNDFAQVFAVNNEKNAEIILTLDLQRDQYVGGFQSWFLIPNQYLVDKSLIETTVKIGSAQQYISLGNEYNTLVTSNLLDKRKDVSVKNVTENGNLHRWINKFAGEWINNTRFFSSNIPLYRNAEAFLLKAEIELALGNSVSAVNSLNMVAKRAYGVDNYYSTSLSSSNVLDKIVEETKKEFVAEGKIWFTLVRNNLAFTQVPSLAGKENVKNILLWPITSASMNTNPNIKQTEGFN